MRSAIQPNKRTWSVPRDQREIAANEMLEILLALDQMVVEVSMRLYNVKHRDRFAIRHNNRRLHASVRKHLPGLLKRFE